jgi:hypothetical protein
VGLSEAREHLEQVWVNCYRSTGASEAGSLSIGSGMAKTVFKGVGSMANMAKSAIWGRGGQQVRHAALPPPPSLPLPLPPASACWLPRPCPPALRPRTHARTLARLTTTPSSQPGGTIPGRNVSRDSDTASMAGSEYSVSGRKKSSIFGGLFKRKERKTSGAGSATSQPL